MKNFWRSRCESMKQQARKHMYIRSLWNSWSMHSIHFLEFFLIFGWFFLQRVYKRALDVIFLVLYSSKWWATSVAELESASALEDLSLTSFKTFKIFKLRREEMPDCCVTSEVVEEIPEMPMESLSTVVGDPVSCSWPHTWCKNRKGADVVRLQILNETSHLMWRLLQSSGAGVVIEYPLHSFRRQKRHAIYASEPAAMPVFCIFV